MASTMGSTTARKIATELNLEGTKLGDIKKRAKEIKKDHELAMALWSIGGYHSRLLSTLIFDKKLRTQDVIEQLAAGMLDHDGSKDVGAPYDASSADEADKSGVHRQNSSECSLGGDGLDHYKNET